MFFNCKKLCTKVTIEKNHNGKNSKDRVKKEQGNFTC